MASPTPHGGVQLEPAPEHCATHRWTVTATVRELVVRECRCCGALAVSEQTHF
ncbi:MAG: hypothetical protein LCI03_08830 [Actinobacteria bacterium]|jgi:hypothetical protein|nr:hypothetical protein [Actinomycetota bacterium]